MRISTLHKPTFRKGLSLSAIGMLLLFVASFLTALTPPKQVAAAACHYFRTETNSYRYYNEPLYVSPNFRTPSGSSCDDVTLKVETVTAYGIRACADFRVRLFFGPNNNRALSWHTICNNVTPGIEILAYNLPVGQEYRFETRKAPYADAKNLPLQFQAYD